MKTISIWVPPTNERIAKLRQPSSIRTSDVVNMDMIKSLVKAMELQAQKIDQQQQQIDGLLVKQQKQQQFGRFAGSKCTTALNCWTEALQRLQEAEQLVNNAVNQTRQAEQNCQTIATNAEQNLNSIATNAEQKFQTTATNAVQKCDAAAANLAQYTSEIASNAANIGANANLANYLCSLHPTCTNSDAYNAVNPSTDTKKPSSSSILDEF